MTTSLRVSEAEVKAVAEPAFTRTWHPVSHAKVIDALDLAVGKHGLAVKSRHYTLAADGNKMFGTWNIDSGHSDRDWCFGFRNGLDKSMALGMTAGTNIIVCANMCFSGDYIAFRKHTNGLDQDHLVWMADKAIEMTLQKSIGFDNWHQNLHGIELTPNLAKAFTFDCMHKGVFPPSKFKSYVEACTDEYKNTGARDLYTYHGGVTRLYRDSSLFNVAESTRKLVGLCDGYKHLAAA